MHARRGSALGKRGRALGKRGSGKRREEEEDKKRGGEIEREGTKGKRESDLQPRHAHSAILPKSSADGFPAGPPMLSESGRKDTHITYRI